MSQMLTNNQTTRTSANTGKPASATLAISWPVTCAGVSVGAGVCVGGCPGGSDGANAGGGGSRPLASVCWKIDGTVARPMGIDIDGHEHSLGEAVTLRTVQLGDLLHMDSPGNELHITARTEPNGSTRVLFVATSLLEALRIPGGRAEWPVLIAG